MTSHFNLSDKDFESALKKCSLYPNLFNHEAHLRLAWIHLRKSGLKEAITNVCNQITRFVNHLGAQDKYNQTLTVAAVHIVHHFKQQTDTDSFPDFIKEFPRLKTHFRVLIQTHYSIDIFTSVAAKTSYLAPDLVPFGSK